MIFSIVNLIDKTNRNDNIYFEINDGLSDFNNDNVQYKQPIQVVSESYIVGTTSTERKQRQYTTRNDRWVSIKPRFFQNNKPSERKHKTTRIKSRNFLSNISYIGINKEDFYNENFISDVYLLVTRNVIRFSLNRKLNDKNKHRMIYMLWKECMPQTFY